MGISTAGGRDGRRNDPRSSAPLSDRIVRANAAFAVLSRSALPQLSAQLAHPHQSAAFWQKQRAGLRSRTRAERSAENLNKAFAFHTPPNTTSFSLYRLRSTRLLLSWEQQSSVGSPKQVEKNILTFGIPMYGTFRYCTHQND